GHLEGGEGAPVVLIAQQLHLEALGGAVDGAQGTRGPEGGPTLLDGRALAHDLLLRVAIDCLSFDRTAGRRVPARVRAKPRARPRSRRLDVLREALPHLVDLRHGDGQAVSLAGVLREEVLVVLLRPVELAEARDGRDDAAAPELGRPLAGRL